MNADDLGADLRAAIGDQVLSATTLAELCRRGTARLGAVAASLSLRTEADPDGIVVHTGAPAETLGELQLALGEGPAAGAYAQRRPVVVADIGDAHGRWPVFAAAAAAEGVAAVFAFPLQVGAVRLGTWCLYRDRPGPLEESEWVEAMVVAEVLLNAVLELQFGAPPGALGPALDSLAEGRAVVHQATGMIAAHLEVGIPDAYVRLRALAYAEGRTVREIATEVVEGTLRLDQPNQDPA